MTTAEKMSDDSAAVFLQVYHLLLQAGLKNTVTALEDECVAV